MAANEDIAHEAQASNGVIAYFQQGCTLVRITGLNKLSLLLILCLPRFIHTHPLCLLEILGSSDIFTHSSSTSALHGIGYDVHH